MDTKESSIFKTSSEVFLICYHEPMSNCRIYVVRHGQTTHNRDNIISGHDDDPELTEQGIAQAQETRDKLAHISFDEVYSSDLQRAVKTAEIIAGKPVHESRQVRGLRERKFGAIDGTPNVHLNNLRAQPYFQALPIEDRWTHKLADDMESDHQVATRFEQALIDIAQTHPSQTVLVAAHGSTLRTLLIHIGFARVEELGYGTIDNAAFVELAFDGQHFSVQQTSGINKTPLETT